jgi:hypothetical protein
MEISPELKMTTTTVRLIRYSPHSPIKANIWLSLVEALLMIIL